VISAISELDFEVLHFEVGDSTCSNRAMQSAQVPGNWGVCSNRWTSWGTKLFNIQNLKLARFLSLLIIKQIQSSRSTQSFTEFFISSESENEYIWNAGSLYPKFLNLEQRIWYKIWSLIWWNIFQKNSSIDFQGLFENRAELFKNKLFYSEEVNAHSWSACSYFIIPFSRGRI
jgi:hypothetical protein